MFSPIFLSLCFSPERPEESFLLLHGLLRMLAEEPAKEKSHIQRVRRAQRARAERLLKTSCRYYVALPTVVLSLCYCACACMSARPHTGQKCQIDPAGAPSGGQRRAPLDPRCCSRQDGDLEQASGGRPRSHHIPVHHGNYRRGCEHRRPSCENQHCFFQPTATASLELRADTAASTTPPCQPWLMGSPWQQQLSFGRIRTVQGCNGACRRPWGQSSWSFARGRVCCPLESSDGSGVPRRCLDKLCRTSPLVSIHEVVA